MGNKVQGTPPRVRFAEKFNELEKEFEVLWRRVTVADADARHLFTDNNKVSFEALEAIKGFTTIGEGVQVKQIEFGLTGGLVGFYTSFEPGGFLGAHYHDCLEFIEPLWGEAMITTEEGGMRKILEPEELPPGRLHVLHSENGAGLLVIFKR